MRSSFGMTATEILAAFTDEITARGGEVTDSFNDGRRLLARSVLPGIQEARPGDHMQGGIAVRVAGDEVWVHPYLFRLVCRNGAIVAHTIETEHITNLETWSAEVAEREVREAIAAACDPAVFAESMDRVRSAASAQVDLALATMPLFARLSRVQNEEFLEQIMDQFFQDGDSSMFGLANAVTATAREVEDPVRRWDLEVLGGDIAAGVFALVGDCEPTDAIAGVA